ncbi:MAG: hypothetical protein V5A34_01765 [Halapricum sp.]
MKVLIEKLQLSREGLLAPLGFVDHPMAGTLASEHLDRDIRVPQGLG